MKKIVLSFVILISIFSYSWAGEKKPLTTTPKDKCAVCGMFVAKYQDFLAQIVFKDGSYAMFDGSKDMFKYYVNLKTYNPAKKISDIDSVYVTDYYTLSLVDGLKAYFVIGSNINGPMGHELIPFISESDAREFMKDHVGKTMVRFNEVSAATLKDIE